MSIPVYNTYNNHWMEKFSFLCSFLNEKNYTTNLRCMLALKLMVKTESMVNYFGQNHTKRSIGWQNYMLFMRFITCISLKMSNVEKSDIRTVQTFLVEKKTFPVYLLTDNIREKIQSFLAWMQVITGLNFVSNVFIKVAL